MASGLVRELTVGGGASHFVRAHQVKRWNDLPETVPDLLRKTLRYWSGPRMHRIVASPHINVMASKTSPTAA